MKAGQRIIVSTERYSDYGIRDSFVVLRNFSFDKALSAWIEAYGVDGCFAYGKGQTEQDFLQSLRASGLVADEPLNKVHLASYDMPDKEPAKDAGDEP